MLDARTIYHETLWIWKKDATEIEVISVGGPVEMQAFPEEVDLSRALEIPVTAAPEGWWFHVFGTTTGGYRVYAFRSPAE